ncbi:hypothetical protein [Pseudarthrobacter sp. Y6]|uniref:hypothetical protein n=1 Tax=Pseudarthrobacter sp. Y6 TaxID=3418422 RepID=UPI003CF65463
MGIEDELNEKMGDDANVDSGAEAYPDVVAAVDEIRLLCLELAKLLLERGVPTEPFEVLSAQPTSRLQYFFKGPASNPMVRAADGWVLASKWGIDVFGQLWEWRHNLVEPDKLVAHGDFAPPPAWFGPSRIDFRQWIKDSIGKHPRYPGQSVRVGGLYLDTESDGRPRLYLFHPAHDPANSRYELFREHLLDACVGLLKGLR